MDAQAILREYNSLNEIGFNLTKAKRMARNVLGLRAIINVPGQREGHVTRCAAITQNDVLHHHANTSHMLIFLEAIHSMLVPDQHPDPEQPRFVVTLRYLFTGLFWSKTGFPPVHSFQLCTVPHIFTFF